MTLTVDASVALKWVLREEGSEAAAALIGSNALIAPDFLLLECANVLAHRVRGGLMTSEQAHDRLRGIEAVGVRMVSSPSHVAEAQRLAMALRQTVYDSLYLAVALAENAVLITADKRFAEAVLSDPFHKAVVRKL